MLAYGRVALQRGPRIVHGLSVVVSLRLSSFVDVIFASLFGVATDEVVCVECRVTL